TSHLEYLATLSDTLPIRKRSTAFKPVAPTIIRSASFSGAISFVIATFGEPYLITSSTFSTPASLAFSTYSFRRSSAYFCALSDNDLSYASAVANVRVSTICAKINVASFAFAMDTDLLNAFSEALQPSTALISLLLFSLIVCSSSMTIYLLPSGITYLVLTWNTKLEKIVTKHKIRS